MVYTRYQSRKRSNDTQGFPNVVNLREQGSTRHQDGFPHGLLSARLTPYASPASSSGTGSTPPDVKSGAAGVAPAPLLHIRRVALRNERTSSPMDNPNDDFGSNVGPVDCFVGSERQRIALMQLTRSSSNHLHIFWPHALMQQKATRKT